MVDSHQLHIAQRYDTLPHTNTQHSTITFTSTNTHRKRAFIHITQSIDALEHGNTDKPFRLREGNFYFSPQSYTICARLRIIANKLRWLRPTAYSRRTIRKKGENQKQQRNQRIHASEKKKKNIRGPTSFSFIMQITDTAEHSASTQS